MSLGTGNHVVTCPPLSAATVPVPEHRGTPVGPAAAVKPATGPVRVLYAGAGAGFVGVAYLGVLLPGLPTTPWVLLASYCFSKSSPRLERWLRRSPVFGPLLRDWVEHRGIRRPVKVLAVCLVATVVTLSIAFGRVPVWVKCVIGGLAAVGVCTITFAVPTIPRRPVDHSNSPG
ncbi:Uncharacterized conserved protein OS=Janthinobacterium sp. (strain Marseille) GN=mma_3498 PE=4 SV=1: DUF454 [Gemmataceae bacterium]|nr:Uncharacterized conserved protein OS=Janthinobacterium sp. (strain Marseille) GN=mma_3498 PE=4 SV=1: DUF454 [Gemmataceae bacterium]VTU00599.1 Uncharacterized conserved protein OS=Janthinobacterium sp. (strain Marseille) GN=mma_3498 PE=4 SV=1: DUF454 [Gemmataceae bacterium]